MKLDIARCQDISSKPTASFGLWTRSNPTIGEVVKSAYLDAMKLDEKTQIELEAAVFRRLVEHLRSRTDVQNIDLMNLAGFCRNCLSNWYEDAAKLQGLDVSRPEARERVYGMPYEEWRAKYQTGAMQPVKTPSH